MKPDIDRDDVRNWLSFAIIFVNFPKEGIILVKEKPPIHNKRLKMWWKLPGGRSKSQDVSSEATLMRELSEELGLQNIHRSKTKVFDVNPQTGAVIYFIECIRTPDFIEGLNEIDSIEVFNEEEIFDNEDDIFNKHFRLIKEIIRKEFLFSQKILEPALT